VNFGMFLLMQNCAVCIK